MFLAEDPFNFSRRVVAAHRARDEADMSLVRLTTLTAVEAAT